MPYEQITEEQFEQMMQNVRPLDFSSVYEEDKEKSKKNDPLKENFCENESCAI
jgi:hypothetical protein